MAYATAEDFIRVFGDREAVEVSNLDAARTDLPDIDAIEAALSNASAEIDSYLVQAGYVLPLATVPAILLQKTCDIARYRLEWRNTRTETEQRYKDAMSWLRDVAKGLAAVGPLPLGTGRPPSAGSSAIWGGSRTGQVFNGRSLRGY
jgi:phage gp36-like protein